MKDKMQKSMMQFFAEAKLIEGAEGAIFKLSEKFGLLVLANKLSILYERPKGRSESQK